MDSFDRRKFLAQSALLGGATFLSGPTLAAKPKRQPIPTPAEWMDKWINDARAVEGALYLGRFADPTYL
ncbi:hypothetical protein JIR23_05570 [Bradyrhizobium diazoefficiens]|nr:hypothetical protein [Bradyrhizobium diazoefficiens]QQN67523.1 hypothetical protein JIR23_05570 [Bradyrhizobium diazoefficiens]